jgi:penicillin-binding protein 1A
MVWHEVMSYAHDGLELKPIHGLAPLEPLPGQAVATAARPAGFEILSPTRPTVLSRRSAEVIGAIEDQFRTIQTAKPAEPAGRAAGPNNAGSTQGGAMAARTTPGPARP